MFGKRAWAVKIIDHAGLSAGDAVGAELIDLLISISKQIEAASRGVGVRLKDPDLVIQAALVAGDDNRTSERLVKEAAITPQAAEEYTRLLYRAAEIVAIKHGREAALAAHRNQRDQAT